MKISKVIFCIGLIPLLVLSNTACDKSSNTPGKPAKAGLSTKAVQKTLDWNMKTLVNAYEKAGHTNPKWDSYAKRCLAEFARSRMEKSTNFAEIQNNVILAIQAGCDDPMIKYLHIRFAMDQSNSKEDFTTALYKAAMDMDSSSYPEIRKFYVGETAEEQYVRAYNWPTNWSAEMSDLKQRTYNHLFAVLQDTDTPASEVYDAAHRYLQRYRGSANLYSNVWFSMEPLIFQNWPNESASWLFKGEAYTEMAWHARGSGFANTVTEEGWKLFKERLTVAQEALEKAWALNPKDPRIAVDMMYVNLGLSGGREQMELWFSRAMELDANNYDACYQKSFYLEPKWNGSDEEMLAFGRECLHSNWGGTVPLTLWNTHIRINNRNKKSNPTAYANYWKNPEVWPDIKASFDRYFEMNPDDVSYRHDYAYYAYLCGQWSEFLNQTTLFSYGTNYNYFGGKDAFNKMLETARQRTSETDVLK